MNLKKKILAVTIIPVLVLGMVSIILTVTMVKSSVMEQVEEVTMYRSRKISLTE